MLRNKKITIAFLLILAISGLLAKAASAKPVSPGDTITFYAHNSADSVGPMEGVTTEMLKSLSCQQYWVRMVVDPTGGWDVIEVFEEVLIP